MATPKAAPPASIINTYVYLVQNGRKKLEDIPASARPYVEAAINAANEEGQPAE